MINNLKIIIPTSEHSEELSNLLIESITTNCAGDYNNDPEIMKEWLANKTPSNISEWINSKNNISFIALDTQENKLAKKGNELIKNIQIVDICLMNRGI